MAKEISRTFDMAHGAIVSTVKDAVLGNTSVHTIYVAGLNGVTVDATVAQILADVDAAAAVIHAAFTAAGWTSGS